MTFAVGGAIVEIGSCVRAIVLDVAKAEHLVDLSLKPEFFDDHRGESSKSQSHKKVKFYTLYLGALYHFSVWCGICVILPYDGLICCIIFSETQKSIQGLGSASNSKCNCGNCERELLGKCLMFLFKLISGWNNSFVPLCLHVSEFCYAPIQVISVPECNYAIGYASVSDYNTQKFPRNQFLNGQRWILILRGYHLKLYSLNKVWLQTSL